MTAKSSEPFLRMFARATHFYPGCAIAVDAFPDGRGQPRVAAVEMSDGIGVNATCISLENDTIELAVDQWKTAKGASIKTKTWILHRIDTAGLLWKISAQRL